MLSQEKRALAGNRHRREACSTPVHAWPFNVVVSVVADAGERMRPLPVQPQNGSERAQMNKGGGPMCVQKQMYSEGGSNPVLPPVQKRFERQVLPSAQVVAHLPDIS